MAYNPGDHPKAVRPFDTLPKNQGKHLRYQDSEYRVRPPGPPIYMQKIGQDMFVPLTEIQNIFPYRNYNLSGILEARRIYCASIGVQGKWSSVVMTFGGLVYITPWSTWRLVRDYEDSMWLSLNHGYDTVAKMKEEKYA